MLERKTQMFELTIAQDAALTEAIDLSQWTFASVMAEDWTAASLGVQMTHDGTTFYPAKDDAGDVIEAAFAADGWVVLPAGVAALGLVKLWSQTSGSNVTQAAARTLYLFCKA